MLAEAAAAGGLAQWRSDRPCASGGQRRAGEALRWEKASSVLSKARAGKRRRRIGGGSGGEVTPSMQSLAISTSGLSFPPPPYTSRSPRRRAIPISPVPLGPMIYDSCSPPVTNHLENTRSR
ncbi:unnamed protein product [Urochloa humidicola]